MCTNETAFKLFTVQPIIDHVFRFANQAHKLFQLAKSIKGKYKDTFIYLSIYYFFFFFFLSTYMFTTLKPRIDIGKGELLVKTEYK